MVIVITQKEIKPVLMEKTASVVKTPYYLIKDNQQAIFIVSAGKNGVEFNKTIGFISNFPAMQTYYCLYGSGILQMQRNDEEGEAKEFKVVMLNPLKQVAIPAGWAMNLINTGSSYLALLRVSSLEEKYMDAKPIMEKRGLAYYVIEKKGEVTFEPNPHYRVHPQITTE